MRNKKCNAGKRFSSAEERKSLVFLKFLVFCGTEESEKNLSFWCVVLSNTLSLSGVLSDRLSLEEYEVGVTKKRKNEENRLNYAYFDAQLRENTL